MVTDIGFNGLDFTVLGVILLSGLLALIRGFAREILSLLSWAGAFFVAARFYPLAEPWVSHYLKKSHSGNTTAFLAGSVIFIGSLILFTLMSFLICHLIRGRALTSIDRSMGFIFGALRGALLVCLVFLAISTYEWSDFENQKEKKSSNEQSAVFTPKDKIKEEADNHPPEWVTKAKVYPALKIGSATLKSFIPKKDIEKTDKQFQVEKAAAEQNILDMTPAILSTTAKASNK